MKVLFLSLKAFSFTGGIEKFNRSFLKALLELSIEGTVDATAISAYDTMPDERYFHKARYKGWSGNRLFFSVHSLLASRSYSVVVLGHINLAPLGWLIKKMAPRKRIVLIVHGIEVWKPLSGIKLKILQHSDMLLSVSEFTRSKLIENNGKHLSDKIRIFPNTLDPYFYPPEIFGRPAYLQDRYRIKRDEKVIITVSRLSTSEKYKGYDHVLEALSDIRVKSLNVRYLLCGRADEEELKRIQHLIKSKSLSDFVTLVGFVKDNELIDHYLLADVFVMPSKKEGFGIVFIEALACGLRVIAGSKDGSREALMGGHLGKLVDPDSTEELILALEEYLSIVPSGGYSLQQKVVARFGFNVYKENLKKYLTEL